MKKLSALIKKIYLACFLCVSILGSTHVYAAINPEITYQANLKTAAGAAVADANYNIRFKLYTAATGGSPLWTEEWCKGTVCDGGAGDDNRITVTSGLLSTQLGQVTSLSSIDFNQALYLEIEVGSSTASSIWDGPMTPRRKIGSVPSAFTADKLNGLAASYYLDASNQTNFDGRARNTLSLTALGLSYATTTGVFSLTSGYAIPLTASTSDWASFRDTPSTRITAGSGLSWSANTLSFNGASIQLASTTADGLMSTTTQSFAGNKTFTGTMAITGAATLSGALLVNGNTTLGDASGDTLTFNAGTLGVPNNLNIASNTLFIDVANNRIGIGTTTPSVALVVATGTSAVALSVVGAATLTEATITDLIVSGTLTLTGTAALATTTATKFTASGDATFSQMTLGSVLFAGAGGLLAQNNSGLFWNNTSARLGIGTTTPANALHIIGGISLSSTTPALTTDALYSQSGSLYWSGSIVAMKVNGTHGQTMTFDSTGTQVATSTIIIKSERVGIGVTAPTARLHIRSESNEPLLLIERVSTTDLVVASSGLVGIGTSVPNDGQVEVKGGTVCVDTNSDGNASSCIASESDVRLKTNVLSLVASSSLHTIMQLRPVSFDWKSSDPETLAVYPLVGRFRDRPADIGFIAQEVEGLVPEAIDRETVGPGLLQLQYNRFIPLIVGAIQEQDMLIAGIGGATSTEGLLLYDPTQEEGGWAGGSVRNYLAEKIAQGVRIVREIMVEKIIAVRGVFDRVFAKEVQADSVCVGGHCFGESDFAAFLEWRDLQNSPAPQVQSAFEVATSSDILATSTETIATSTEEVIATSTEEILEEEKEEKAITEEIVE